jgi:uncharacterized membrane protein
MTGSIDGRSSPRGAETTGRIIVALFEERAEAEDAIRDLKTAGFTNEQIGVATQDRTGAVEARPTETTAQPTDRTPSSRDNQGVDQDELGKIADETASGMAEGAATGALTGGVIGGLVGLISSLLIPGVGPLVVGGVLASSLLGMGVGAATGGLIGALVGMGVPEEDARYFDAGLRNGRSMVTVINTNEAPDQAISILERHGGDLGPSRSQSKRSESYRGEDRRTHADAAYAGPERRLVGV